MLTQTQLSQLYQQACLQELQALKPGNVHVFADGHNMQITDFIESARVSANPISDTHYNVGQRIFHAVQATYNQVGMNTNLGIILLCAPLLAAFATLQSEDEPVTREQLQQALSKTLNALTLEDAIDASCAIVLANPGGLGDKARHDVNQKPTITLLDLMRYAQADDRIAWQYANQFSDIFCLGLDWYEEGLQMWENDTWSTTWVYINYLSTQLDSHVVRKYGQVAAAQLMDDANRMKEKMQKVSHPNLMTKSLMIWDDKLKEGKINPGTSADLTVATVLTYLLCKHL